MRAERAGAAGKRTSCGCVRGEGGRERHRAPLEPGESGGAKMNLVAETTVARSGARAASALTRAAARHGVGGSHRAAGGWSARSAGFARPTGVRGFERAAPCTEWMAACRGQCGVETVGSDAVRQTGKGR